MLLKIQCPHELPLPWVWFRELVQYTEGIGSYHNTLLSKLVLIINCWIPLPYACPDSFREFEFLNILYNLFYPCYEGYMLERELSLSGNNIIFSLTNSIAIFWLDKNKYTSTSNSVRTLGDMEFTVSIVLGLLSLMAKNKIY